MTDYALSCLPDDISEKYLEWQQSMGRLCLVALLALALMSSVRSAKNIVVFLTDDAGFYDFESQDPNMHTPNIRKLREDGLFLNHSYVLPMCTPTRAAFLTGRVPHTFGMQDITIGAQLFWINESYTLLPRELKKLNYTTHMLGKWHLGNCHPGLTPIGQGFDTFYGMWYGAHNSYYNHTSSGTYDWWDGWNIDLSARGHYKTDLIADRGVQIISRSRKQDAFFMYVSFISPHGPKEVPQHYIDTYCSHITIVERRIHCGMMAAVDTAVGRMIDELKRKDMYEKTVILFISDNGAAIEKGGVNYPLRGGKKTMFEGGIRSYTIFKTRNMAATNITWPGMVTAVDWFPTLITAAGGVVPSDTHGKNVLWVLKNNRNFSPRKSFVYVSDHPKFNHTVARFKDWKLIRAMPGLADGIEWRPGFKQGWYPANTSQREHIHGRYSQDVAFMFNLREDPFERNNIYGQNETILRLLENEIEKALGGNGRIGEYPLQPLQYPRITTRDARKDGYPTTCWCNPAGLRDSPFNSLCPFNVSTTDD